MKSAPVSAAAIVVAATLLVAARGSATEGELHLFTSKSGQQISAVLLDVSEDRRLMTIRRDDGQQFQTEILSLSLEDQHYIRDWMNSRPVSTNFAVDLGIQRKQGNTQRRSVTGSLTLESRTFEYEIVVGNRSRETLSGARLEYAVVLDDQVTPIESPGGDLAYSLFRRDESNLVRIAAEVDLEPIAFNREATVVTHPAPVHLLRYASSGVFREDELLGVQVRLLAADGSVIAEGSSGTSALERLEWESIAELDAVEVETD